MLYVYDSGHCSDGYIQWGPKKLGSYLHGALIKTHGSESRGQEEAACTRVFWPTRPLQ